MNPLKILAALLLFLVIGACNQDSLEMSELNKKPLEKAESTSIEDTSDDGCETAFATWGAYTQCFLDLDLDDKAGPDFNRWGWTNGPMKSPWNYYYNLYAGVGQCDKDKGTDVGRVYIKYNGSSINVKYVMEGGHTMSEVHFYVGDEILPTGPNGKYTVAPGKYTYKMELQEATSHEFTIDNITGTPYFIAHAVVCGFPIEE